MKAFPGRRRMRLAARCVVCSLSIVILVAAARARTAAPPPPPSLGLEAVTTRARAVTQQLSSAVLFHEAPPPVSVPPVLRALVDNGWKANNALEATSKPLESSSARRVRVKLFSVFFTSHRWRGGPVRIFGYYGYPATSGRKPGLLLVHGGGGYATTDRVIEAARRGYAALSIDLPGKGTQREHKSRSTGPDMTVSQLFTVKPDLTDNYIYHAVLAQMRAISFLCAQDQVDGNRIGLVGVSWGGATGLITTSLDRRVKCFVNLYGSGYIRGGSTWHDYLRRLPPAEADTWEAHFDAAHYLAHIRVPVLGITGTNDNCYYLPQFLQTLRGIQPTPDLLLRPNLDHKIDTAAKRAYYQWLDAHLQGSAAQRPRLERLRMLATPRGARVYVQAGGKVAVGKAEICYSPVRTAGWTNRKWQRVRCVKDTTGSWHSAEIPLSQNPCYVFATVYFHDGSALSTPVHTVTLVHIDRAPLVLDYPLLDTGPLKVEAHLLAKVIGAQLRTHPNSSRMLFVRHGRRAECEGHRIGDLHYIGLREACEQLGGRVHWVKGRTEVWFDGTQPAES